jgi:hypothetical protein
MIEKHDFFNRILTNDFTELFLPKLPRKPAKKIFGNPLKYQINFKIKIPSDLKTLQINQKRNNIQNNKEKY